jgi:penicillin-insensitive murein DD-endopeptidase
MSTKTAAMLCMFLTSGCGFGMPTPLAPALEGSIGLPHHGVVTDAQRIGDRGDGFVRFRGDDIRWGLPRLVSLIETSARAVSSSIAGPPLIVGDLGARRGGMIDRHRSHRSGRDVDLVFFAMTPDGRRIRSPGFVKYGADGLAENESGKPRFLRFDTERNWLLVKALISNEKTPIQWMFVSHTLEVMLLNYGIATGEPTDLIYYAATVMQQPSDSAKHDDHFHLRVACLPEEMIAGCTGGPTWPFHASLPAIEWTQAEIIAAALDEGPL